MMIFSTGKQQGFTLLEIMIALFVIAIALGAVISTTGTSVEQAEYLKEKTLALWVAQNVSSEVSISRQWLATGKKKSTVTMAQRKWYISNNVTTTADKSMRKMDISIYSDPQYQHNLLSLTSYIVNLNVNLDKQP